MTWIKKGITALFAAALLVNTAQAVQLNPGGLGEVLIYPYYTVRQGEDGSVYNTLLSVTNDNGWAKAIKVHIREGQQGKIVVSFNLFLPSHDVWTAALTPDGDGLKITTYDTSCTAPSFQTASFFKPHGDENNDSRVQEGYIEMIEMGTVSGEAVSMFTHRQDVNGYWIPADCVQGAEIVSEHMQENKGGLFGSATLINVQSGLAFTATAVALYKFAKPGTALGYTPPESDKPDMTSAHPISIVPGNDDDALLISEWDEGTADAVAAALMVHEWSSEYILESATSSKTTWIGTLPLFYTLNMEYPSYRILKRMYGREEQSVMSPGWTMPAPPPDLLTAASNSIPVSSASEGGDLFFSKNTTPFFTRYDAGYTVLRHGTTADQILKNLGKTKIIRNDGTVSENQTVAYYGIPLVGFAAHTYTNAGIELPDGKIGRSIYGVMQPYHYRTEYTKE